MSTRRIFIFKSRICFLTCFFIDKLLVLAIENFKKITKLLNFVF